MPEDMEWGSAKAAGFVLGALLKGDRELARVGARLGPEPLARVREKLAHVGTEPREKAQSLRTLIAEVRPVSIESLPPRARALLASRMPRGEGRVYVQGAPPARPGYEVDPELLAHLERVGRAQRSSPP